MVDQKYGAGTFDRLPESRKVLLVDYAYNGVLHEFPNFMRATVKGDKAGMLKEYKRYTGNKPLTQRNEWTRSVIEGTVTSNYNDLKDKFKVTEGDAAKVSSFAKEKIDSAEIFAKKYKVYLQNVTRKILELFLKELFNVLKGKLKKIVSNVIGGIFEKYTKKQKQIIIALTTSLFGLVSIKTDFKKCKSVIDSISKILDSINLLSKRAIIPIPPPLLLGAQFLPGFSSERAKINVIAEMQNLGLKTENLLDGSPNRVLLFVESIINGMDSEEIANGAIDGLIDPLLTGRVFAKKRHS
jgi:hypothetical protein